METDSSAPQESDDNPVETRRRIVVYRLADGREIDRAHRVPSSNEGGFSFRPGSTTLAFTDDAEGHRKNQQVRGQ